MRLSSATQSFSTKWKSSFPADSSSRTPRWPAFHTPCFDFVDLHLGVAREHARGRRRRRRSPRPACRRRRVPPPASHMRRPSGIAGGQLVSGEVRHRDRGGEGSLPGADRVGTEIHRRGVVLQQVERAVARRRAGSGQPERRDTPAGGRRGSTRCRRRSGAPGRSPVWSLSRKTRRTPAGCRTRGMWQLLAGE